MTTNIARLYFSKRFTSGLLKGITIHGSVYGPPITLKHFAIGTKGHDWHSGAKWVIVDASFQNYAR